MHCAIFLTRVCAAAATKQKTQTYSQICVVSPRDGMGGWRRGTHPPRPPDKLWIASPAEYVVKYKQVVGARMRKNKRLSGRLFQALLFSGMWLLGACSLTPPPTVSPYSVLPPSPAPALTPTPAGSLSPTHINHSSPAIWDNNLRFERLNSGQGLSQNSVLSIAQDQQGYMWFGTWDGLNRFDGTHFTVYQNNDQESTSLSDNTVSVLYVDRDGILWAGTPDGGLNRFDRHTEKFDHFHFDPTDPQSLSSNCISAILEDSAGNLWVGTCNSGLNRLDRQTGQFVHYHQAHNDPKSLGNDAVTIIYEDHQGTIWVGTGSGLDRYKPDINGFTHFVNDPDNPSSYAGATPTAILEDRNGAMWIGTFDHGLEKYNRTNGVFKHYRHDTFNPDSINHDFIRALLEDENGAIWIATYGGGIDRLIPENGHFIHHQRQTNDPQSLSSDIATTLFQDKSGIIWVGTNGQGLNRYNPRNSVFFHYRHLPGQSFSLSHPEVNAILVDSSGYLWVGSAQGLDRIQQSTGNFTHYIFNPNNPNSLSGNLVTSLLEDNQGMIWVGTLNTGLNRYDPIARKFIRFRNTPDRPYSLSSDLVTCIFQDRADRVWIGTADAGLNRLITNSIPAKGKSIAPVDPAWSIVEGNRSSFEQERADLEVASVNIIPDQELFIPGSFKRYTASLNIPASLSSNDIRVITEDENGLLWIGTNRGLDRFDPNTATATNFSHNPEDPDSLGNNQVISLLVGSDGAVWVGTDGGGLDRLDRKTGRFSHFSEVNGLPNNVIYGILEDGQGDLWLSTNKGLSRFNPHAGDSHNYGVQDGLQGDEFNKGAYTKAKDGELFFGGYNGISAFYPEQIGENRFVPPVTFVSFTQNGQPLNLERPLDDVQAITLNWPDNFFEFEFTALGYTNPDQYQYAYWLENFDQGWNAIGVQHFGRYTNLPGGNYRLHIQASNSDGYSETKSMSIQVVPPLWQTWWFRGLLSALIAAILVGGYSLRLKSIRTQNRMLEHLVHERTTDLEQTTLNLEERNREIEHRRSELEALYEADEVLRQHLQLDQVLQALVDVAVDVLKADLSAVLMWDDRQNKLTPRAARGFGTVLLDLLTYDRGQGLVGYVAEKGVAVIVQDAENDPRRSLERPEVVEAALAEGIRSFILLPVNIHGEIFGVFNVSSNRVNAFGEQEERLFSALAQRAALAISNAQLYEQASELAALEERNRLARDLHDSAKQKAFAALAQLGAANGLVEKNADRAHLHLAEAEGLVHEVLQEIDTIVQELHPAALQAYGLSNAVREYAYDWAARHNIEIDVQIEGQADLPLEMEQSLYRIIQESLSNIARHSQASKAEVSMIYSSQKLQIMVCDNGRGFDLQKVHAGLGLYSMRERAEKINGELQIESSSSGGTRVLLALPLSEDMEASSNSSKLIPQAK
jgi:ligand-binding sensor domain-containing protein/signal transduction histidine kinase